MLTGDEVWGGNSSDEGAVIIFAEGDGGGSIDPWLNPLTPPPGLGDMRYIDSPIFDPEWDAFIAAYRALGEPLCGSFFTSNGEGVFDPLNGSGGIEVPPWLAAYLGTKEPLHVPAYLAVFAGLGATHGDNN